MVSWLSGIHIRAQNHHHHKPPSWYENEISLDISNNSTEHQQQQEETTAAVVKRRVGLLPKLRRAIEAATHASNGSFPIQDDAVGPPPVPPPSPGEETAFEACDSISSQCSQSVGDSCSTQVSYDMSRIDEDGSVSGVEACDSVLVGPSPTASDVDSLFGVNIRDMATRSSTLGSGLGSGEDRDDVWLLSSKDEINVDMPAPPACSQEELKSPAASIRSRVPVLVLPGLPDRPGKRNQQEPPVILCTSSKDWEVDAENEQEEEEEEIEFDDSTFLISETEEQYNLNENSDENRNSNIMMRAQLIGKNLKGIWNSTDCGKRVKMAKRKYRNAVRKKKKTKQKASSGLHCMDPLKELSKCHEKMSENEHPFSPKRAFSRIRDRIRKDPTVDSTDRKHSVLVSIPSSASSIDEASEISLPSELFPSISHNTSITLDAGPSVDACPSDKAVGLVQSNSSENPPIINHATPIQDDPMAKKPAFSKPPPAFKIKFKSPRNDTPRIVLGDEITATDSGEEPRALYTDEGFVDAYIHPKGSGSGSMGSRNSLNHVFHSELSTLYEVSSSLESASFSTTSGSAASTEATSMCATAGNSRTGVPLQVASSSTTSDSSTTNQETSLETHNNHHHQSPVQANKTLLPKDAPNDDEQMHNQSTTGRDEAADAEAEAEANANGCFVDDREVKMRWEFTLGLMEDQGLWRQPNMPLMNTEEMADDYVAEI